MPYSTKYYEENREAILLQKKEYDSRPEVRAKKKEWDANRPRYEPDRNVLEKECRGNPYHKCGERLNTFKENGEPDWFVVDRKSLDGLRGDCRYCQFVYVINKKYGKTFRQILNMMVEQGNKCAHKNCKVEFSINEYGIPTGFHIDHNHKTGFVRGLLCPNHNRSLYVVENTKEYEGHTEYLEEAERKEELENLKKHNRKNNNIVPFKEGEDEQ